jgi:hypothetical protein
MTTTSSATEGWVPSACTLPTVEQPLRLAEFDNLFRTAVRQATRTRETRLDLVIAAVSEASARDLADRESGCCSFFEFSFTAGDGGSVVMGIGVPSQHVNVLDALHARVSSVSAIGGHDV